MQPLQHEMVVCFYTVFSKRKAPQNEQTLTRFSLTFSAPVFRERIPTLLGAMVLVQLAFKVGTVFPLPFLPPSVSLPLRSISVSLACSLPVARSDISDFITVTWICMYVQGITGKWINFFTNRPLKNFP